MNSQASKSVTSELFLIAVQAHEILCRTGVNIIYNKESNMSTWVVGTTIVGMTRGSICKANGKYDAYLFTNPVTDYKERLQEIIDDLQRCV